MKVLLVGFSLMLFSPLLAQKENIFDRDHSLRYANYLMMAQEYEEAAMELERLHFMLPQSDSIKLALLQAYLRAGSYQRGIKRFEHFYDPARHNVPTAFALEYLKLQLREEHYQPARDFLRQNAYPDDSLKQNLTLSILLLERQWEQAYQYSRQYNISDPYLNILSERAYNRKRKSPLMASLMSAVLPGSGKMYCGKWADGAMALVFVAGNAFGAYRGFERNGVESFYGWFFSAVGTGFYIGNIYGSHQAAERYNQQVESILQDEVEDHFYSRY